ncbi:MAG TPA: protein kinase [bacterium]|nr:protein kinase [bacterium]
MRYERLRRLGGGETADTFLCSDRLRGGRLVARKVFFPEWSRNHPDLVDREFRTLAGISHPHVAAIEDFGEDGDSFYLVSEFVEGRTILDHLRGADLDTVAAIFVQVLEALDHLYFRNVVHLDLKPENVLVRPPDGSQGAAVKLIDFGLSTLAFGLEDPPPGAIGSPPFTAPELALGRRLDTRSDLYSAGALLYAAVSGRLPYDGEDLVAILNQQLKRDPVPLHEVAPVSRDLSGFVQRLMARDSAERFENPRAALRAFGEALGESFPVARAVPIPLFEDPDLIFRKDEVPGLFRRIRDRGGLWAIRGAPGMGKTFLARWLERAFWRERRPVVSWTGERLVLSGEVPHQAGVAIIDDADRGPVAAWAAARGQGTVIALGETLEDCVSPPWTAVDLKPLTDDQMEDVLQALFGKISAGKISQGPARPWTEGCRGIPRDFVRMGRGLLRGGAVRKEGAGWRWEGAPLNVFASVEGPKRRLLGILRSSRISLEAETLGLWTDQSVAEVEETLQELAQDGWLQRGVEGGRTQYRSFDAGDDGVAESDPGKLARLLQDLYDEGRYRDGLDLLRGRERDGPPSILRLRAKHLASAGSHAEALEILTDDFLANLPEAERPDALETRGKALIFSGRMEEAARDLTAAAAASEKAGDDDGLARALLLLGVLKHRAGKRDEALTLYERAVVLAPKTPRPLLVQGTGELNLANLFYDLADLGRAEGFYQKSIESLKETRHAAVTAQAHLNYAALAHFQGKLLKAAHLCREALRRAVDARYELTQGRALLLLAMIHEKEGRTTLQDERLSEAVAIFEKAGFAFEAAQARIHRAYFYETAGRLDAAESDARSALERAGAIGAADLAAQARLVLGRTLGRRGQTAEAKACVEEARRHFAAHGNAPMEKECAEALRGLGGEA